MRYAFLPEKPRAGRVCSHCPGFPFSRFEKPSGALCRAKVRSDQKGKRKGASGTKNPDGGRGAANSSRGQRAGAIGSDAGGGGNEGTLDFGSQRRTQPRREKHANRQSFSHETSDTARTVVSARLFPAHLHSPPIPVTHASNPGRLYTNQSDEARESSEWAGKPRPSRAGSWESVTRAIKACAHRSEVSLAAIRLRVCSCMVGMISWALFVSGRDAGDTRRLWCWPKAINSARAP